MNVFSKYFQVKHFTLLKDKQFKKNPPICNSLYLKVGKRYKDKKLKQAFNQRPLKYINNIGTQSIVRNHLLPKTELFN